MLHRLSCAAAMALVLLPIGGLSYYAQADMYAITAAHHGGCTWLGGGMVTEPGAIGLIFMGGFWLFLRGYGKYCCRRPGRD